MKAQRITPQDSVAVALVAIPRGSTVSVDEIVLKMQEDIPFGHKIALCNIKANDEVIKYGNAIGAATRDIAPGEHVHTHNMRTQLDSTLSYRYEPEFTVVTPQPRDAFMGFRRADGGVGVRNEVWIVPTVSCVNRTAQEIARRTASLVEGTTVDGVFAMPHPYGCSQMGDDLRTTQEILRDFVNHPNAGGVLVLGLGCENNYIGAFQEILGSWDPDRVRFLNAQDVGDEVEAGVALIRELIDYAGQFKREACPASALKLGLKCGGSDAFSGITGNPLIGWAADRLVREGGSPVLTEVPEMFGAEHLLMKRAVTEKVFDDIVAMINGFKEYFIRHGQVIYENPAPGNKEGGITTLEEKSLGCVHKGGTSPVCGVVPYAGIVTTPGLNLLTAPGNDLVSITALAASGCQLMLFTTGRGNPLGSVVPTIKVSTNTPLYEKKPGWIDFNAGPIAEGSSLDELGEQLWQLVLRVASGERTKNELTGNRDYTIFKDGVTV